MSIDYAKIQKEAPEDATPMNQQSVVEHNTTVPPFNYKFAYRELKLHTQCIQEMMENSDQPAKHFSQFLEKGLKAAVEMGKMASMIENWEDAEDE